MEGPLYLSLRIKRGPGWITDLEAMTARRKKGAAIAPAQEGTE